MQAVFPNSRKDRYRFTFNGQEQDDEVKGNGNSLDFGARIYDPRLARFLSLDPLTRTYPYSSPYIFSNNNPIRFVDHLGKNPDDVVRLTLEHLGRREGHLVQFDKATQETVIVKLEIAWEENRSAGGVMSSEFTILQTYTRVNSSGEIIGVIEEKNFVRAEIEKQGSFFAENQYKFKSMEVIDSELRSTYNKETATAEQTNELNSRGGLVNGVQSYIKSGGNMATGEGISSVEIAPRVKRFAMDIADFAERLGLEGYSTGTLSRLFDETTENAVTSYDIPKGKEGEAYGDFIKAGRKLESEKP